MKRFNRILCVVEPEATSLAALHQAARIAEQHQARLTLASVLRTDGAWGLDREQARIELKRSAAGKRDAIDSWAGKQDVADKVAIEIYSGIEFIEIIRSVIDKNFDLVVKCADDVDWLDRLFASDDMHLLRKCPCPVLMLKPGQSRPFETILAAVDVGEEFNEPDGQRVQGELNRKVLEYSAALSVAGDSELHIGSAWHAYAEDFLRYSAFAERSQEKADRYAEQVRRECAKRLDRLVEEMRDIVGDEAMDYLKPRVHLVKGRPAVEIPRMARQFEAGLVVMGTVARTGIPGFIIGNTAEAILEQVQCSVLAIKSDGFVSPIRPQ